MKMVIKLSAMVLAVVLGVLYSATATVTSGPPGSQRDTGIRPVLDMRPKPTAQEVIRKTKQALTQRIPDHYKQADKREVKTVLKHVYIESRASNLDPILVLGLIAAESSFNKLSLSPRGAVGYTQVMPRWHADKIKDRDIKNTAVNIQVGVKILSDCFRRRKTQRAALACYNGATKNSDIDQYTQAVYSHMRTIRNLAAR